MTSKDMYRIKPFQTLLWWVACSLFAWPLSVIALALVLLPLSIMLGSIGLDIDGSLFFIMIFIGFILLTSAIIGLVIGHLQRWLLRKKHYWAADDWQHLSMIGGAVGGIAAAFTIPLMNIFGGLSAERWLPVIFMMVFLTILSLFQVRALRHAVKQVWLWVVANAVSGIVFGGLLINNDPGYGTDGELLEIALVLFAAASIGLILGLVMIFLFERHMLPLHPEGAEIEETPQQRSVWDEVI